MVTFISRSPEETRNLGKQWGQAAQMGWVIALSGDLGAGKTQLVNGIARGLGITERISSPTFTLVHEYKSGRLPLFHLDLYRLETASQIIGAGLEEYFNAPRGLAVIEWAERWFGDSMDLKPQVPVQAALYRAARIELFSETERRIVYEDFIS